MNTIGTKTVMCFFIKLGRHVHYDERMNPIEFEGQRPKVKVTIDIYGNKLVNKMETKSIKLGIMLAIVKVLAIRILEVTGQKSRSQWTYFEISL